MAYLFSLLYAGSNFAQTSNKNMQPVHQYITEIIRYTIPAAQQAGFEKAYADAGQYLQTSPYCLGYQVIHGAEEATHYIVIIRWTSTDDHLNGFRQRKEFAAFFNLVKPFYNNIDEMKHDNSTSIVWNKEN